MWWNGWPLVFNDTGSYLETARTGVNFIQQSPGYGMFLHLLLRIWHRPEIIALAQATLVVVSLWHLGRVIGTPRRRLVVIMAAIAVATPIPLLCAMLLPDAIFLAGTACLFALIIRRQPVQLIGPIVIVSLAMTVHYATAPLYLVILLVSLTVLYLSPRQSEVKKATRRLIYILAAIFFSTQFALRVLYPRPHIPVWSTNVVAQLVDENGLIIDELKDTCDEVQYSLCPHIQLISGTTADHFLWRSDQALQQFGGWDHVPADWQRLIFATVKHHPEQTIRWIFDRWQEQFFTFQIGYEFSFFSWDHTLSKSIENSFGRQSAQAQLSSKQEQQWFNPMPKPWPQVYDTVAVASVLAPLLLWLLWRRDKQRHLAVVLLTALLVNALIMGTVSHPQNRYQFRLLYLPLVILVFSAATPRPNRPQEY